MKRLFVGVFLISIFSCFKNDTPKVLIYIEDNSSDLGFMLTHEVGKMSEIIKKSGYKVVIATISGETIKSDSIIIKPDIRLHDVDINEYAGFIMPCMAPYDTIVTITEKNFVRKVVSAGKPIAAQIAAVLILAKAGALNGKKFAFPNNNMANPDMFPEFKTGIYSGDGVIQDGNIITSGTCPMEAKMTGSTDGTPALTKLSLQEIKANTR